MKTGAKVLLGIVATLVMLSARIVWSSREAYGRALHAKDPAERRHELSLAARMYAPGNPYSRGALLLLLADGKKGGEDGRHAYEEVRAAILGTRSFYTPHVDLLEEANNAIAVGLAQREVDPNAPGPKVGQGSLDERTKWHLDRLQETNSPILGWTLLAILGLTTWIAAAWRLFGDGFDDKGHLTRKAALYAGAIVLGLGMFYLGMLRA